jgi:DNA repair protein RecO (recombination protein O)
MLVTTRGLVLKKVDYGESSIIAKIYTEKFGLQSYIFKGIKKNTSRNKRSLLEHLTFIEITAYHNEKSSVKIAKEIRLASHFIHLQSDIYKSSIAVFINEIIYKTLKEEENNYELFNFLLNSLQILDLAQRNFLNFHLIFLMNYVKYLGFYPINNFSNKNIYFNLNEGIFQPEIPLNAHYIDEYYSKLLSTIINLHFDEMDKIELKTNERRYLLEQIIKYYQLHINDLGKINSLEVLKEVLS